MGAGAEIFNQVINQQGSPALFSATLANRPAFGYTGRIFIATDTREIYRDTGTSWELIGSGGGSVNIYNSNGTLNGNRLVNTAGNSLTFSDIVNNTQLIYQNTGGYSTLTVNSNTGSGSGSYISSANGFTGALSTFSDTGNLFGINRQGFTSFNHSVGNGILFGTINNTALNFGTNNLIRAAITNTGRFLLGTLTDAGFLADINGTSIFRNDMRVHAQSGIRILNAAGVTNSGGYLLSGSSGGGDLLFQCNYNGAGIVENGGNYTGSLRITSRGFSYQGSIVPNSITQPAVLGFNAYRNETTGGNRAALNQINYFEASSGTAGFVSYLLTPNLNFTGSYNATLYGIRYNPTMVSMTGVSHIALQTDVGIVDHYDRLDLTTSDFSSRNAWTLHARLRQTLTAGADQFGAGYYVGGLHIREISASGANTFGNATINAGGASTLQIDFTGAGTLTASQAGLRAFAGHQIFNTFGGSASGTITHFAGMQILGLYNRNTGVITPTITNAYGLIINNLNDYSHTFTLTNRWGLYQTGSLDNNYLAGKLLIGTTTVTARQVHIAGNIELTTTVSGTAGGSSGDHLSIWINGVERKIALLNP